MEKLYTSKTFLKMAGGRRHYSHPTSLDPPLAISYKHHQNSLAYFSCLTLVCSFLLKDRMKRNGQGGRWHNALPPPSLNTILTVLHLFCDMIIIGEESTIAFSSIDKLVALFYNLEKAERKSDYKM